METILAPEPTANLFSSGDQRTQVAARLILRNDKSDKTPQQPEKSPKQKLSRILPEKYKSVLPSTVILFHPNVGVPIRRAGHYPAVGKVDYKQWIHHRFLVILNTDKAHLFVLGAQSMPVTLRSCWSSFPSSSNPFPLEEYSFT